MRTFLVGVFLIVAVSSALCAGRTPGECMPDTINNLWYLYQKAGNDSSRIMLLLRLAYYYNDLLEDKVMSDSLAEAAIRIAEQNRRRELVLLAYLGYTESTDPDIHSDKSIEIANRALQLSIAGGCLEMRWRIYGRLVTIYARKLDERNALSAAHSALAIAKIMDNPALVAESYLLIGKGYESGNRKIEAVRNYLTALDIAMNRGEHILLKKYYSTLSGFYMDALLFNEAKEFIDKEIKCISKTRPIDSTGLMWARFELLLSTLFRKNVNMDKDSIKSIIDFAIRTCNQRLKSWTFSGYRQYLLESNRFDLLQDLYTKEYPDEFRILAIRDPEMFIRLKAYFLELDGFPDSADFYFRKVERRIFTNGNKGIIYQANFFNRYGQFLKRHGKDAEATGKFIMAYRLCEADRSYAKYEYMLTAARYLETLYREVGDYKNAWYYADAGRWISDSISNISKTNLLMAEAVRQERIQNEVTAERDRQKIRQGKTQRNMLAAGVGFFIVVTMLVYRNYRNQKRLNDLLDKAKKQSDHLLLNILPLDTAEELKSTGRAKAKRFNEVTVMFTDFKDFTQASERMSAEELVDEINFYFSEFDRIISRHNLEKIKIIGDSYMCAGGLPVANVTHAADVVAAAVELQQFMIRQKEKRKAEGRTFFELRIGIHTGPVVAGIVGLKKFAYDIWGDTVNTASRMENAGEQNKVNISGTTYEKVKDLFTCTYRGKVHAKHKGLIDMYFVDPPHSPSPSRGGSGRGH